MAFSEKASSPTVPTNHDPNRLNRQVASVPQTVRRHRRKGNRISDGSHVVVEAHGNGNVAEGEGFEPPKACTLVVFKPQHPPLNTMTGPKGHFLSGDFTTGSAPPAERATDRRSFSRRPMWRVTRL